MTQHSSLSSSARPRTPSLRAGVALIAAAVLGIAACGAPPVAPSHPAAGKASPKSGGAGNAPWIVGTWASSDEHDVYVFSSTPQEAGYHYEETSERTVQQDCPSGCIDLHLSTKLKGWYTVDDRQITFHPTSVTGDHTWTAIVDRGAKLPTQSLIFRAADGTPTQLLHWTGAALPTTRIPDQCDSDADCTGDQACRSEAQPTCPFCNPGPIVAVCRAR
jgi:hypothetical protein